MDNGTLVETTAEKVKATETKTADVNDGESNENDSNENLDSAGKTNTDTIEDHDATRDLMQLLVRRMSSQLTDYRLFFLPTEAEHESTMIEQRAPSF